MDKLTNVYGDIEDFDVSFYKNNILYNVVPVMKPLELDEKLENLTQEEKLGLLKLSHRVRPVLRFNFVKERINYYLAGWSPDAIQFYVENEYEFTEHPVIIPQHEIIDEDNTRYATGFYGYIKSGQNIFKSSFLSNPEFLCGTNKLKKFAEIKTYHYYVRQFLPTETEVLLQIPDYLLKQTIAYEVAMNEILPNEYITPDSEHIEATIRLFKKADKQKYPEIATEYFKSLKNIDNLSK